MDVRQGHHARITSDMKISPLAAVLILTTALWAEGAENWRSRLKPENPGPFPMVRPFEGDFRFGWSNIEAAKSNAKISFSGNEVNVEVEGGTTGLARTLWSLDAKSKVTFLRDSFKPVRSEQYEKYAKKEVSMESVSKPDGLWYIRWVKPSPPESFAKWKRMKVQPTRDIVGAMFFIRSQPLKDGDKVGLIAFPGDSAYLVEVEVKKRETITVAEKARAAIRLEFKLQKIETKGGEHLVEHTKFRNGTVWLSDDQDRIPLRAEVDIFIGYVYGELKSVTFH